MIFTAFAEVFSIGAILPFLSVLLDPAVVFNNEYSQPLINFLKIEEPSGLLLPLTCIFGLAALLAGAMRLLLLLVTTRLAYATGADLTIDVYRKTLYQPYSIHIGRNSSSVINVMVSKVNSAIQSTLIPLLMIISSVIMISITLSFLISIEPLIISLTFAGFGFIYLVVIFLTNYKLATNSQRIALEHKRVVKLLQEGLGGIREILLSGSQEVYADMYRKSDIPLRRAQGTNVFIGASPRFGIEALAMMLLGFVAYFATTTEGGISEAIPIIGILTLGAQRLLPVIQQIFVSWSSIQSSRSNVEDTIEFLDQELPKHLLTESTKQMDFKKIIEINNLSFRYSENDPWIIKDLNLNIKKGSRIGFIGSTGTGKSTLIDLIMGLLEPTEGKISIDGTNLDKENIRSWQKNIAQVPQMIFLADNSIKKNIALGVKPEKIDLDRIVDASKTSKIHQVINDWPNKYETHVGERGIRLSGGQRQRIGIARALYKDSEVLIFDEATSSLDTKTENEVIEDIYNLSQNLTIIMIAHRLTTLKKCDQIIELENGKIKNISKYEDLKIT